MKIEALRQLVQRVERRAEAAMFELADGVGGQAGGLPEFLLGELPSRSQLEEPGAEFLSIHGLHPRARWGVFGVQFTMATSACGCGAGSRPPRYCSSPDFARQAHGSHDAAATSRIKFSVVPLLQGIGMLPGCGAGRKRRVAG
jgi:hypothetical protein